MPDRRQNNDHDLLIELRTEMQGVRSDIKELKEGTAQRLVILETDHVARKDHDDHENRLRFLERYAWMAIGIIGLIDFIGFAYLISKLNH